MKISGRPVSAEELLKSQALRQGILQYIMVEALRSECSRLGVAVDPVEINTTVENRKASVLSDTDLTWEEYLDAGGMTDAEFRESIEVPTLFDLFAESMVETTEEELLDYWAENKDSIVKRYLEENFLPTTDSPNVTFEDCRDLVEEQLRTDKGIRVRSGMFELLINSATLELTAFRDKSEAKLYEDLILNNRKTDQQEEQQPSGVPSAAAPGGGQGLTEPAPGEDAGEVTEEDTDESNETGENPCADTGDDNAGENGGEDTQE
ncbi:hypothetical protein IIA79_05570 [bacterium]|nr:hypothetical protein [bacterium]